MSVKINTLEVENLKESVKKKKKKGIYEKGIYMRLISLLRINDLMR